MRIAVVGAGISGMLAAYLLCREHDLTVFEAEDRVGGHTHTHAIPLRDRTLPVDSGFIVYNEATYPNFTRLLSRLDVPTQPSTMSFSVRCERSGVEWAGADWNTIFAQRRNLLRPTFLGMLRDVVRFNREAKAWLENGSDGRTLGEFVTERGYSRAFVDWYLVPMGAAVWSADPGRLPDFPARTFLRFWKNHGFLEVDDRPQWRVIRGGSNRYAERLTAPYRDRIRTNLAVAGIRRRADHVEVKPVSGEAERFDEVILACHSDQALALLTDPSPAEREILGAIRYQENDAVLHTDVRLLPRARRAWSSWNTLVPREPGPRVTVTYDMNRLQSLDAPETFCVTLNRTEAIDPARILRRMRYHHPVYTAEAVAAQGRRAEISGVNRTNYCGAYWGYGFHEDGVNSALAVCARFGTGL